MEVAKFLNVLGTTFLPYNAMIADTVKKRNFDAERLESEASMESNSIRHPKKFHVG